MCSVVAGLSCDHLYNLSQGGGGAYQGSPLSSVRKLLQCRASDGDDKYRFVVSACRDIIIQGVPVKILGACRKLLGASPVSVKILGLCVQFQAADAAEHVVILDCLYTAVPCARNHA